MEYTCFPVFPLTYMILTRYQPQPPVPSSVATTEKSPGGRRVEKDGRWGEGEVVDVDTGTSF